MRRDGLGEPLWPIPHAGRPWPGQRSLSVSPRSRGSSGSSGRRPPSQCEPALDGAPQVRRLLPRSAGLLRNTVAQRFSSTSLLVYPPADRGFSSVQVRCAMSRMPVSPPSPSRPGIPTRWPTRSRRGARRDPPAGPRSRVACETMVTTGLVVVAGEITTAVVRRFLRRGAPSRRDIGYTGPASVRRRPGGGRWRSTSSPPTSRMGVDRDDGHEQGAGDQG